MSDRFRAEPDFWRELQLNVEKLFTHYALTFPLKLTHRVDFYFMRKAQWLVSPQRQKREV